MSNTKLLKSIDWFIDVPDVSGTDEFFENESIFSSIFEVEFNNVRTHWRLSINFNFKNERYLCVFLERCSDLDHIHFDCGIHISILNSQFNTTETKILISEWKEIYEQSKSSGRGPKMIKSEELMNRREEICHDGKLHLRAKLSAINLNVPAENDFSDFAASLLKKLDLGITVVENHSKPEDVIFEMITSLPESDILIKTDDGMTHKVHKSVLSEKSSVFKSMFTIDMEETANKSVEIIEFKGPVMKELIRFIYFGKVHNINQVNVELFKAAKAYEIANLPELCLKSIVDVGVTHKNVIEVVELAHVYDIHQLFNHCCDKLQILRNHKSIQEAVKSFNQKLRLEILNSIASNLKKLEIHTLVETCDLAD